MEILHVCQYYVQLMNIGHLNYSCAPRICEEEGQTIMDDNDNPVHEEKAGIVYWHDASKWLNITCHCICDTYISQCNFSPNVIASKR